MTSAANHIAKRLAGVWRVIGGTAGLATFAFCGTLPLASAEAQQLLPAPRASEQVVDVQNSFDTLFGTEPRGPRAYTGSFEQQLAAVAEASHGRIGVAAMDLSSGRLVEVLGNQRFPMASTSKVAIAATFLEGVDKGKWSLSTQYPLMVPTGSRPFSSAVAPVRAGDMMSAQQLLELMITRSNNYATDALLRVVGGPSAVNGWISRAGIDGWHIDRDIATLVRDDGAIDPARVVDNRDSATPVAMVRLLSGIYQGKWLSPSSRDVLLGAMSRCITGKNRIRAGLPQEASISHKTGSLSNTSSDIGLIQTTDGRVIAVAIYVTGQGSRPNREVRIASIARTVYNGYLSEPAGYRYAASR